MNIVDSILMKQFFEDVDSIKADIAVVTKAIGEQKKILLSMIILITFVEPN